MGRSTKPLLDPEVQDEIMKVVAAGNSHLDACLSAGISERSFYRWKARGEAAKTGKYRAFFEALQEAEASGKIARQLQIRKAGMTGTKEEKTVEEEILAPNGVVIGRKITTTIIDKPPDWKAIAWLQERRYPDEYGPPKQKLEHEGEIDTGQPAPPVYLVPFSMTEEGKAQAAEAAASAQEAQEEQPDQEEEATDG